MQTDTCCVFSRRHGHSPHAAHCRVRPPSAAGQHVDRDRAPEGGDHQAVLPRVHAGEPGTRGARCVPERVRSQAGAAARGPR